MFDVGRVGPRAFAAVRTLLPFPHPVRITVTRGWSNDLGAQDAFVASLLSSPVMASAAELVLDGVFRVGLPGWLAKSPFLGDVRSLRLSRNGLTCAGRANWPASRTCGG